MSAKCPDAASTGRIRNPTLDDLLTLPRLRWLWQCGGDVAACVDLSLRKAVEATESCCGAIFLNDAVDSSYALRASFGLSVGSLKRPEIEEVNRIAAASDGAPAKAKTLAGDSPLYKLLARAGPQCGIFVPVGTGAAPMGLLILGASRKGYSRDQAAAAANLAFQTALLIRSGRAQTDARESLAKLESILVNLADGVVVCDAENRIVMVNRAAEEALDIHSQNVIGKSLLSLLPSAYRRAAREALSHLVDPSVSEPPLHDIRVELKQKILRINASPVLAAGKHVGFALVLRDVTMEEEVGRAKSEFISTVAHELKTPLTALKGSIGLIRAQSPKYLGDGDGEVEPGYREMFAIAESNCNRLIRLVDDMMDIAKIEAGRMSLRLEPVSLYECVVEAVKEMHQIAAEKSISLAVRIAGAPPLVTVDCDRMEQVVMNLLSNAIRYSPKNGEVIISVRHIRGYVRVSVQDFGPGIPRRDVKKVFDKFYQVGGPASRKDGGTGLGLAICKAIVERHGGKIYVRSDPGHGSCFVFIIPVPDGTGKAGETKDESQGNRRRALAQ